MWTASWQALFFAGEEIEHDGQIEPTFGGWHAGDVGEPNLIRSCRHEGLFEQIRRDRQVVMAVRGAHPNLSSHSCPDAVMTHEAFDAATAHHIPPGAQGRVNPGRAIVAAMCHMDPPDLGQQGAIGRLAQTFWPATPGIIPRRREIQHIAHGTNLEGYCQGLIMPCERKSVEPMAAMTAAKRTAAQHQSLLHFVGQSP